MNKLKAICDAYEKSSYYDKTIKELRQIDYKVRSENFEDLNSTDENETKKK